jgi:arylsulfatase
MIHGFWLFAVLAGCQDDKPIDVFLIAVDTLRVDHVGAYNPVSPAATPHIDALASDAIRFDDAFTPISVTGPAFASVMTGRGPAGHGVMVNLFRNGAPLEVGQTTIAERFSAAGYRTAAFVSSFTLRSALGLDQGFTVYNSAGNRNRDGRISAEKFGSWLGVTEGPVFAWYHTFDPHGPFKRHLKEGDLHPGLEADPALMSHIPQYQQIEGYTDPGLYTKLYARGVEAADTAVGWVIEAIKATGRYDDALIIFFSDHGEGFQERDLWFDHGAYPHVEQARVPLLVKLPKGTDAGTADGRLVSLIDIAPTALAMASLQALPDAEGVSLRQSGVLHPSLSAESSHCKRIDVLPCSPHGGAGKVVAVRTSALTLVSEPRGKAEQETLYHRGADPKEWMPEKMLKEGVAYEHLRAVRLDRRARDYPPLPGLETGPVDPELEQLKGLGYLE